MLKNLLMQWILQTFEDPTPYTDDVLGLMIEKTKENIDFLMEERIKPFLKWLIDNNHIEKIGEGEINDYIRYVAATEDPMQTFIDLLK